MTSLRALPPLAALRAFEAAARHASFTRAAEELGLTQGAVSHQVRALEEALGRALFIRMPRQTALTDTGERLARAVREGLGRIAVGIADIKQDERAARLTVSLLPGFAVKWLFPRLIRFDQRHPNIEIGIQATADLADFATGDVDVAIRYGPGRYPGLYAKALFDDDMFPVAAPKLARSLKSPADLAKTTLLHDDIKSIDGHRPGWHSWLTAANLANIDPERGRRFGQANMVLQAATEGLGVALGRTVLVADDLAAGRLVAPFELKIPSGYRYYFVCPKQSLAKPKVARFRDWLVEEAAPTMSTAAARMR